MARRPYSEQAAWKHIWGILYMVQASGRFIDTDDVEQAIADGHDTVGKVMRYFGMKPIGAKK